jgi:hypothetical protein
MEKHNYDMNSHVEKRPPTQLKTKTYHRPQLMEWGNLQELSRGGSTPYVDQHGAGTTSNPLGAPPP